MNEIEKIEYRILELEAKIPGLDPQNWIRNYGEGYLDALKDVINLLKSPSRSQA